MQERPTLTIEVDIDADGLLRRRLHPPMYGPVEIPAQRSLDVGRDYVVEQLHGLPAIERVLLSWRGEAVPQHLAGAALERAGEALFEALFGPHEPSWAPCFVRLFGSDAPVPTRHAVRVRIVTRTPFLLGMPWNITAWQQCYLRDYGWTFEIAKEMAQGPDVDLRLPNGVLFILPGRLAPVDSLASEAHYAAMSAVLDEHIPGFSATSLCRVASTREAVVAELRRLRPAIVYYYGQGGQNDDGEPWLGIPAENALPTDDPAHWNVHDVARAFRESGSTPAIVYLNGGLTGAGGWQSAARKLSQVARVVLAHSTTAWSVPARMMAVRWLRHFLAEEGDPIRAAAARDAEEPTAHAWLPMLAFTDCRSFVRRYDRSGLRQQYTAADLDRHHQRTRAFTDVRALVHAPGRRVQAFLAHGTMGNHENELAKQLHRYIEVQDTRCELHVNEPLNVGYGSFAAGGDGEGVAERLDAMERRLKLNLGYDWKTPLSRVLEQRAPASGGRRRVLWLDWHILDKPKVMEDVQRWLAFCSGRLAAACPEGVRLVTSLFVRVPVEKQDAAKRALTEQATDPRYRSDVFRCTALLPIGPVEGLDEIVDFLEETGCTQNIRNTLARWLWQETGGDYAKLRVLVERGLESHWMELYAELAVKHGSAPVSADFE